MEQLAPPHISHDGHVATLTIERPPHNFIDPGLLRALADALQALDADPNCRAIVLAAAGKNFSAGADFGDGGMGSAPDPSALYGQAMRLFESRKPIIAAVQGAAVGAGAGLALAADFRVAAADSRFSFNFNRLGFHPGFGLSCTLPRLVGVQKAALLFHTGRRIGGEEAAAMGLVDQLAPAGGLLAQAQALAQEIAASAPLAVQSTRATLRQGLAAAVRAVNQHELVEQLTHFRTQDFAEGVRAMGERRSPAFHGR